MKRFKKACTKLEEIIKKLNKGANPTQNISWVLINIKAGLENVLSRVKPN